MKITLKTYRGVQLKSKDTYCNEDIDIDVDKTSLKPENIKKGTTIFGVTGSFGNDVKYINEPKTVYKDGVYEAPEGYCWSYFKNATDTNTLNIIRNGHYTYSDTGYGTVNVNIPGASNPPYDINHFYPSKLYKASEDFIDNFLKGGGEKHKYTDMSHMFEFAHLSTKTASDFPIIDTDNVTNMDEMFEGSNIRVLPLINTSKVTSMSRMFYYSEIEYINLIDTSNVVNMSNMFYGCSLLKQVPLLNTSKVTNMKDMFYECKLLTTVPALNINNVINAEYMFYRCSSLTNIGITGLSKITKMSYMFSGCENLKELPFFDTSTVQQMDYAFSGCKTITSCPAYDISNVFITNAMFSGCDNLVDINLKNISCKLNISYCIKMKRENVRKVIDNLIQLSDFDSPADDTHTLYLSQAQFDYLTEEDKNAISFKKWKASVL